MAEGHRESGAIRPVSEDVVSLICEISEAYRWRDATLRCGVVPVTRCKRHPTDCLAEPDCKKECAGSRLVGANRANNVTDA